MKIQLLFMTTIALSAMLAPQALTQSLAQTYPRIETPALQYESRMPMSFQQVPDGLKIVALDPEFEQPIFSRYDPNRRRNVAMTLEVGDIISEIDDSPVTDVFALGLKMKKPGKQMFKIVNVNGGTPLVWEASPRTVEVAKLNPNPLAPDEPKVFAIHVVDTGHESIGEKLRTNVPLMQELFSSKVTTGRIEKYVTLQDDEFTALKLLNTINDFQIRPVDTLFVYYQGHGGYLNNYRSIGDSGGHAFPMRDATLLRYSLVRMMHSKKARMTILVTDCCNNKADNPTGDRPVYQTQDLRRDDWSGLESLLFCHAGFIDVTSAARGNLSWCSDDVGSWFTNRFIATIAARDQATDKSWQSVWDEIKNSSESYFQWRSESADPDSILGRQKNMLAHEYRLDVISQKPIYGPSGRPVEYQLRQPSN